MLDKPAVFNENVSETGGRMRKYIPICENEFFKFSLDDILLQNS